MSAETCLVEPQEKEPTAADGQGFASNGSVGESNVTASESKSRLYHLHTLRNSDIEIAG